MLPIDEKDDKFNLKLVNDLVNYINNTHKMEPQISKYFKINLENYRNILTKIICIRIRLGIVSVDNTTVYYDFSLGLDSPFAMEQLEKTNQNTK